MLASACSLAQLVAGDSKYVAKLERLEPSPLVLKAPDGVKGDFTVAKEAPAIDFAFFPNQWEGARLWSDWGDSICASDGNFYAAIGDHEGPHGTSYVYRINPARAEVELIVDYNKVVGMPAGKYSPGKIHAPICEMGDGWIYFVGYRGSEKLTRTQDDFKGDWLLRYELKSGKTENLGVLVPDSSEPSMEAYQPLGMLYGLSAAGESMPDPKKNQFFAYSVKERKLVFLGLPGSSMIRSIIVTKDGRVYYDSEGKLVRYDPAKNNLTVTDARLPGDGRLRAASKPDKNGVVYGFSNDGVVFSFDPNGEKVTELVKAFVTGSLYTTSCELSPGGRYLYYVTSAHGGTHVHGTAVIQLDVRTKQRKVLAFLNEYMRQKKGYNLGGTYGLALSADGSMLFANWNGGPVDKKSNDFGLCSAMVLHIPASERSGDE